jgi:DNA-binding NtrC family response regulator
MVSIRGGISVSRPLQVLLIDDEPIVGKRLVPALAKDGYEVEFCVSGREALALIDAKTFDIVVTDVRMEDVDGLQILEHVRARSQRTRVIIITGYATIEVAREALAKGACDFIAKPFKPNELREVIAKAAESLAKDG